MKTSVVLLALATAALAAPALHEETFEEEHHIPAKFLDTFTRERKSLEASASPGSPVNLPATSQISEFGVSGRTFNLKKPIIIKKKVNSSYQVYRNSDEEKLDSPEPCRKQVRVNLCDEHSVAKSSDMMESSTIEDSNIQATENDMKHSIKLAKEAVENLQKDLRKIEHKPAKTAPWKNGDSESDIELHQDIEVARQALEHIHNNFGILETPNTHDTSVKAAEHVEDVALPLAQTEEERLAQWKDAIENIQKNVELVKNIEDSFKSSPDDIPRIEAPTSINKHELHKLSTKEHMRVKENEEMKEQLVVEHSKLEKSSEQNEMKTDVAEKDMLESASMVSASKMQELNHNKARLTPEIKSEHITKTKNTMELHGKDVVDTISLDNLPQNLDTMSLKKAEEEKERKTKTEHIDKKEKLDDSSIKKMKSVDSESVIGNHRNAEKDFHGTTAFKDNEHARQLAETEDMKIEMKSAEHITDNHDELIKDDDKIHEAQHTMKQIKQASDFNLASNMKKNTPSLTEMKINENMVHKDHSFVEGKMASEAVDQHKEMMGHAFEMKAAEDTKSMQNQAHMRWVQDKNFNTEHSQMKSAVEAHQTMNPTKMHSGHHHHQHTNPHPLDASHGHLRHQDQFMAGKSADMDKTQANYYMNMRDSGNMEQEGHRFRWRPTHTHESGRSAYGAPALASAPASGAVGLFPNANIGNCGIPLLLSCNPSVVSGSLSKPHTYSAPAYRSEDDFNFHTKRNVKKADNPVNTLKTQNPSLKNNAILVAKQ